MKHISQIVIDNMKAESEARTKELREPKHITNEELEKCLTTLENIQKGTHPIYNEGDLYCTTRDIAHRLARALQYDRKRMHPPSL